MVYSMTTQHTYSNSQVFLSHEAFHHLEDFLRSQDTEELKHNRMRGAEIEGDLDMQGPANPYAPYRGPESEHERQTPYLDAHGETFNQSDQALPLIANASPFQRADMHNDYDERQWLRSDEFDGRSRLTSARDDTMSLGTDRVLCPVAQHVQNVDKKALLEKEVLKETSAHRRWVALCWLLTWWVPTPFLRWFWRMKCMDVRQAWHEKLARAQHYYLVHLCLCRLRFGNLVCPMEHVFSTSELASQCGEQRRQYLRRHSWGSV